MFEKKEMLYEGKAKRIYATNDSEVVWIAYKDDATAFNGVKKESITGKGVLNNEISSLLFQELHKNGVSSHFVQRLSETEQLVKKVDIVPLEVVVRNIAAGSLAKRIGWEEGTELPQTVIEFYYKSDELNDPMINEDHIALLNIAKVEETAEIRKIALQVNNVLTEIFENVNLILIDFKLEFGRDAEGNILLADEISPDTCRLWDATTKQKLDKDVFRRELGSLTEAYNEVWARLGGKAHV